MSPYGTNLWHHCANRAQQVLNVMFGRVAIFVVKTAHPSIALVIVVTYGKLEHYRIVLNIFNLYFN
jgi:hypothetical protein